MTEKLHTAAAWLTANGKNRALRWLVVLGVAGILLIALSEWLPGRSRAQAMRPLRQRCRWKPPLWRRHWKSGSQPCWMVCRVSEAAG